MIYVYMYIMTFYVITKDKVTNNITPHNTAGTFLQTACIIIWFCDNVSIFRAFLVDFYFWFYGLICLLGKNLQCCCKSYQIIKMTWKIVLTIFGASAIAVFFSKAPQLAHVHVHHGVSNTHNSTVSSTFYSDWHQLKRKCPTLSDLRESFFFRLTKDQYWGNCFLIMTSSHTELFWFFILVNRIKTDWYSAIPLYHNQFSQRKIYNKHSKAGPLSTDMRPILLIQKVTHAMSLALSWCI